MLVGTLNIRGGGNALKRKRISALISKCKADIFLIQETKLVNMHEWVAKSFWRGGDIGFSFSNSVGRSGGLLTLWKEDNMDVVASFKGEGFLGIKILKDNIFY